MGFDFSTKKGCLRKSILSELKMVFDFLDTLQYIDMTLILRFLIYPSNQVYKQFQVYYIFPAEGRG